MLSFCLLCSCRQWQPIWAWVYLSVSVDFSSCHMWVTLHNRTCFEETYTGIGNWISLHVLQLSGLFFKPRNAALLLLAISLLRSYLCHSWHLARCTPRSRHSLVAILEPCCPLCLYPCSLTIRRQVWQPLAAWVQESRMLKGCWISSLRLCFFWLVGLPVPVALKNRKVSGSV